MYYVLVHFTNIFDFVDVKAILFCVSAKNKLGEQARTSIILRDMRLTFRDILTPKKDFSTLPPVTEYAQSSSLQMR